MIYVLRYCLTCRNITDHYGMEHGTHLELICDVCETSVDVNPAPRRELVEVA